MFDAVLVANRGEIACRVIRTVQRLGARAVAVYSDADAAARHVTMADAAVRIGPAAPAESYLRVDAIVDAALQSGAQAVHPGYGFLSERAALASAVEAASLAFVGPTPGQLKTFGSKHATRELAERAGVPLLPGSGILDDLDAARDHASAVGYPIVLKAVAGGGGIGMRVCDGEAELEEAFASVVHQSTASFGDGRVFLERFVRRARHVEVQIFGDGHGRVVVLGDRECSVQRRNQKVVEEAPALRLPPGMRDTLHRCARGLGALVRYRSAGTVELLIDDATGTAALLEVNARLQVEHPVTEEVTGVDVVEWMLRLSAGETAFLDHVPETLPSEGHAIEARVYAEDPGAGYRPSAGTLTTVDFPPTSRVDTWIEAGAEVSSYYDPLLAKLVVRGDDRAAAVKALDVALCDTRIEGVVTNLDQLRAVVADDAFRAGEVWTAWLDTVAGDGPTVEVLTAGASTTVQELPGRLGFWGVGVPPSGPMDDRSFRLGNRIVGNPEETAAVEATAMGPALRFRTAAILCLAGAPADAELDGQPVPLWTAVEAPAGSLLRIGTIGPPGLRTYVCVRGGIDVAPALGSRATFDLGQIGGYGGRALRVGDVLHLGAGVGFEPPRDRASLGADLPVMDRQWIVDVEIGPHASPDFLTDEGMRQLLDARWEIHHNSSRTGVRLLGPNLEWTRADGGEAGLHPSNIHDTAYAVGTVDLAGDMPIILGPDGPSLGGFVCPATVLGSDRWKVGQLRPGDSVRLRAVEPASRRRRTSTLPRGVLDRWEPTAERPEVTWRQAGDENILVEYGPMSLDLALRFRVHSLEAALTAAGVDGIVDTTGGIRSLQVHVDPRRLPVADTLTLLQSMEDQLGDVAESSVGSRIVHLPLSWDDPAVRLAVDRYASTVRADAPWCPWNIEFIRRINGLDSVDDVRRILFSADYLVMGLGDVYLGAPVATPVDPRHRLVTTKYNPARTWTPENAVGIGGAYLCVYGMEGPGGYQLVGRTVQMWNRHRRTAEYTEPWLLRAFDRIRFFPVGPEELLEWRRDLPLGRRGLQIDEGTLRLADHLSFLEANRPSIQAFAHTQQAAFAEERARWAASGEFDRMYAAPADEPVGVTVPPGWVPVESSLHASVWQVPASEGHRVSEGDVVVVLEAMKMEMPVHAPVSGHVRTVAVKPGQEILPGQVLVVIEP